MRRLRAADYRLLAEAIILLLQVRLGLSFSSLQQLQHKFLGPDRQESAARADVPRIARVVRNAARLVPGASCLTQGLAYQILLHRRGVPSELKIGVRHNERGEFAAHAWVSVAGQVQLGGSRQQVAAFAPIAQFGAGRK
ncbi:lasso peptide biosynthesis B2 protein [Devosia sp. 1566]|uniref:lasso peptide biosynthesis B2 protein n=1 Tax=Devosia sp. 1566 TaxID=2499144 RepID=UPI0013E29C20|nr:lasso peptide biosynthesis B2 protein [Devosia sp. 1566]